MDKIEFQLLNQCEDFQIYCHSSEISQVLLNLFSNSIEALENNKIKKINITLKSDSLNNILYFTDSGDLIKPEIANNLMTPFYTTKEVGKGSGLGLSISNSIVNKHGGVLKYETGYPTTTFSLSFPKLKSS